MKHLALAAALAAIPLLPAQAAPGCSISPIRTLLVPSGVDATMRVSNNGKPCGQLVWVQPGVIPFTRLEATREPRHGIVSTNDPTQFSYVPNAGYTGPDSFDIIAYGDSAGGAAVTGALRMKVNVTR